MESEQATPVDSIKDVVWSSVKIPEFDKHLKKAGGHIGRNVVEITIKMKTIVRKPLMIGNEMKWNVALATNDNDLEVYSFLNMAIFFMFEVTNEQKVPIMMNKVHCSL